MGDTFFININCSKILENCDESQYTMCIDSKKMSIVYELTEWIRWMFSLEYCIYLMHENSVIHELEDIQFLSKLKNFEIRPCGQSNCVHKKKYRILLDNLHLFVSWNNMKVHKYFLEKLAKVEKGCSQENQNRSVGMKCAADNTVIQDSLNLNEKTNSNNIFLSDSLPGKSGLESTPLTKKQVLIDNFIPKAGNNCEFSGEINDNTNLSQNAVTHSKDFNCLNDLKNSGSKNLMVGHEKSTINHSFHIKNDLNVKEVTEKNPAKSGFKSSQKRVRPFSVGELLSNIRENFERQNLEETNTTSNNSSALDEGKLNENIADTVNSFLSDDSTSMGRKRQRVRRRKRPKKSYFETNEYNLPINTNKVQYNIPMSTTKANHIRFDSDNEDNLMETECLKDDLNTENESGCKTSNEMKNGSSFVQTTPEKFVSMDTDKNQGLREQCENSFLANNVENKTEEDLQIENEKKEIDLDNQTCENNCHSFSADEGSKSFNPELNNLLKLKEKFKNVIVVERFY